MALEVEVRYRVAAREAILEKLTTIGASFVGEERHRDTYFAPPHRDFAKTDEALRIRRTDAVGWITYKGPKIDAATKTRREVEAPLEPASADFLAEILKELSFKPVLEVAKTRAVYTTAFGGFPVSISLDHVQGLDDDFIELEIHAEEAELDDARSALLALAEEMQLQASERRSYLEMLLAAGGAVTEALVAFGANLGDPARMFDETGKRLEAAHGIHSVRRSSLHRTAPVGGPPDQPAFFNGAFAVETTLTVDRFFAAMRRIEADLGRLRKEQWGPRTIDLDLALFDGEVHSSDAIAIPHPRMHYRRFVLSPAVEVAPSMVHPLLDHDVRELHSMTEQIAVGEVLLALINDDPGERRAAAATFSGRFPLGTLIALATEAVPGTAIVHAGAIVGLNPAIHLPGVEDRKLEQDLDRVWEAASARRLWIATSAPFQPGAHPTGDRIVPVVDLRASDPSGRMREFVNFLDGLIETN